MYGSSFPGVLALLGDGVVGEEWVGSPLAAQTRSVELAPSQRRRMLGSHKDLAIPSCQSVSAALGRTRGVFADIFHDEGAIETVGISAGSSMTSPRDWCIYFNVQSIVVVASSQHQRHNSVLDAVSSLLS